MSAKSFNPWMRAIGYTPALGGLWRKTVEFDRAPRRVVLVRSSSGRLVRVERLPEPEVPR